MPKVAKPSLQASDHFVITPSDTLGIAVDAANTDGYTFCYVHNATATGTQLRVKSVDGRTGLIYLAGGQTSSLMVSQVFATAPVAPAGLYAHIGRGGSF